MNAREAQAIAIKANAKNDAFTYITKRIEEAAIKGKMELIVRTNKLKNMNGGVIVTLKNKGYVVKDVTETRGNRDYPGGTFQKKIGIKISWAV